MKNLSLQRLEIFKAVFETCSISETARQLGLAQPTVSRHLRYFEDQLGFTLFATVRGRLRPTFEAHELYEGCKDLSRQVKKVENVISSLQEGEGEVFRIMAVPSLITSQILTRCVGAIHGARPDIRLSVDTGSGERQLQALRHNEVDMGLAAGLADHPDMRIEVVGKSELVGLVSRHSPLAQEREFHLSYLQSHPGILLSPVGQIGSLLHRRLEEEGIEPQQTVTSAATSVIPGMVAAMKSCAVLDRETAVSLKSSDLVILPLSTKIPFEIQAFCNAASPPRQAEEIFIKTVKQALQDLINL